MQIREYKQKIMGESINQNKDSTSEYSDSNLVKQLTAHSIIKDDKYLKMFLHAKFGTDSTTSLSFNSFLPRPFLPGTLSSYTARLEYTQAVASSKVAARVFYSKEFVKVMDPILLILSGPLDLLERAFTKWGKALRTDATSTEFPTIALGTPTGCARLLSSMLTADLMLLTGESLFLQERFYRAAIAAKVAISASVKVIKPIADIGRPHSTEYGSTERISHEHFGECRQCDFDRRFYRPHSREYESRERISYEQS